MVVRWWQCSIVVVEWFCAMIDALLTYRICLTESGETGTCGSLSEVSLLALPLDEKTEDLAGSHMGGAGLWFPLRSLYLVFQSLMLE